MTAILMDLDGTIADSAPGIIASYKYCLKQLGHSTPADGELSWVIGPPLRSCLSKLLPKKDMDAGVALYRSWYSRHGLLNAPIFPGIYQALVRLRARGYRLFVCTTKPTPYASELIVHLGIQDQFDGIYGSNLDGRYDNKADLIDYILRDNLLTQSATLMVGDRDLDIYAAFRNNIRAIGVRWGYAIAGELEAAKPTALCDWPADLEGIISTMTNDNKGS